MKRFYFFPVLGFLLLLFSCEKWQENQLDPSKKQTLYNISYGPHKRNKLDIALPAGRSSETPVVIFIHGGAWVAGERSVFSSDIQQYADNGIACATINYRYADDKKDIHHPALPQDVRLAVDFLASKSQTYQISPFKFGLTGHSAGGHLSLITAYTLNSDNRIKACASWAGPVDFTNPDQLAIGLAPDIFKTYMGFPLVTQADSAAYRAASPYYAVTGNSVPTLLVYATADELVPYSNGQKMNQKLTELGVDHQFMPLQGASHVWTGNNLTNAQSGTLNWFLEKLP